MAYAKVRVKNRFETHDTIAPTPSDAFDGAQIINQQGNIGLTLVGGQSESNISLDTTVEPPVLRLNEALAGCALSVLGIDGAGKLIETPSDYPKGSPQLVSGVYTGPGCELVITTA